MESDDCQRGSSGVVSSMREITSGRIRLALDDVKNESLSQQGPWKHHALFTWKDYDIDQILNHELPEKELADFGFNVLARLVALHKHPIE